MYHMKIENGKVKKTSMYEAIFSNISQHPSSLTFWAVPSTNNMFLLKTFPNWDSIHYLNWRNISVDLLFLILNIGPIFINNQKNNRIFGRLKILKFFFSKNLPNIQNFFDSKFQIIHENWIFFFKFEVLAVLTS